MPKPPKPPGHVIRQLDRLTDLVLKQVPVDPAKPNGTREPAARQLRRRVEAITSNPARGISSRPDGFSARTPGNGSPGGGKGGGPTIRVEDRSDPVRSLHVEIVDTEDGPRVVRGSEFEVVSDTAVVPVTSVELAMLGRVGVVALPEPIEAIAARIERQLDTVVRALAGLAQDVDRYERLRSTADVEDPPQCWIAATYGLPWDDTWAPAHLTRFDGVLDPPWPEHRPVSAWVYQFTRKHKRVPTDDECRQYLARGIVYVRDRITGEQRPRSRS